MKQVKKVNEQVGAPQRAPLLFYTRTTLATSQTQFTPSMRRSDTWFRNVVVSSFGMQLDRFAYQMTEKFKKSLETHQEYCLKLDVNLSVKLKLHIIFSHMQQFFNDSPYSEQVTEGANASPMPTLKRFKNRKASDLNAIINFFSKNIN